MGCASSSAVPAGRPASILSYIPDNFATLDQLQTALRSAGLESSNLIVGIDFTKSNEWTGKRCFGGRSLHDVSTASNPYSTVISIMGRTLESFDDDRLIPVYGFGAANLGDDKLFAFNAGDTPCHGFQHVLQRYASIASSVMMAGPTTFAPIIRKAVEVVIASGGQYHILVIVADGQVTRPSSTPMCQLSSFEQDTADAIAYASNYPLSILLVGVGDGPWDLMQHFDDSLPNRKFDNWQTVIAEESLAKKGGSLEYCPPQAEAQFALDALMEVPDQYTILQRMGKLHVRPPPTQVPRVVVMPPPDAGAGPVQGGYPAGPQGGGFVMGAGMGYGYPAHAHGVVQGGAHGPGVEHEEYGGAPLPSVTGGGYPQNPSTGMYQGPQASAVPPPLPGQASSRHAGASMNVV